MLYCPTNYSLTTVFSDNGDIFWGGGNRAWDSCHEKCDARGADDDNTTGVVGGGEKKKIQNIQSGFLCCCTHRELFRHWITSVAMSTLFGLWLHNIFM